VSTVVIRALERSP